MLRAALRLLRSPESRADWLHERRRRRLGEPALPSPAPRRVLVICKGNLCRSPFAAAALHRHAPGVEVRSAGLEAAEGEPADATGVRVAEDLGIRLEHHRTHRMAPEDLEWADLILGMEGRHAAAILRCRPAREPLVRLLGDFLPEPPYRIADPWGESDEAFRRTFHRIECASRRLGALLAEAEQ